ncbi:MAG: cobalamin biosynthesis protein CbiM [Firmicutes bacterium]|nr:cobalamin biosynthesis protein CbiM [Bacillota bacterium]
MHMADALVSPAVGGAMWAAAAGLTAYSAKKVRLDPDEKKVPLMGVLGAFIFAAQMINFTIPGTGSSGHLGGGLLLAALLGPYAGFLTMASILAVQGFFFGDGGLLAMGCNIFNLGFYPCFIAYPLLFKPIVGKRPTPGRILAGASLAAIVGLQLGSFSVVLETLVSGISELPFRAFLWLMQPVHLAIGIVEGLITAAVLTFVWKARPELLESTVAGAAYGDLDLKKVLISLSIAAALTGGALSWFASTHPDGLEWALFHASGKEELEAPAGIHQTMAGIQEKTAILPDYGFKTPAENAAAESEPVERWPAVSGGTSFAGLVGGLFTLLLTGVIGYGLRMVKKRG